MIDVDGVDFIRPPKEAVQAEEWMLTRDGVPEPLPPMVPDWDYNLDLQVSRIAVVDSATVRRECRLPDASVISFAAVWRASGTALRGLVDIVPLQAGRAPQKIALRGMIPAREAAGALILQSQLLLSRLPTTVPPLAPRLPGSVLWDDAVQVALEGSASRFPVEVVDFSAVLWAPVGAGWHLAWNPHDLRLPVSASVTLYINSGHAAVISAVRGASREPGANAIRSAIYFDVGRALIHGALRSEEFMEDPDGFPEGTLGRCLRNLLHLTFPGDGPDALRSTLLERSEFFDSMLQETMQLFGDLR